MRRLELVVALFAVLAVGTMTITPASAVEGELLPGTAGTKLTGKSKKAKFQVKGGATVECTGSETTSGEVLSSVSLLIIFSFKGCKSLGLAANGLGLISGLINAHVEVHICLTSHSPFVAGLRLELLPLHVEVPSAEQLITLSGSVVIGVEPQNKLTNTMSLVVAQKGGVQSIDGCRSESNELEKVTLTTLENESGEAKQTGIEMVETSIAFEGTTQEELMS